MVQNAVGRDAAVVTVFVRSRRGRVTISARIEEDSTGFDFDRIGLEVDAGGGSFGLTGGEIEPAVVFGTFDGVVHDEPTGKMDLGMRAEA